jgi:hypothetical protein
MTDHERELGAHSARLDALEDGQQSILRAVEKVGADVAAIREANAARDAAAIAERRVIATIAAGAGVLASTIAGWVVKQT